jgi:hypothetical protein
MSPFDTYLSTLSKALARGNATEHTHRPALQILVQSFNSKITATNEPTREACGAPDYSVSTDTKHGPVTLGYIEAKDVGVDLAATERSDQLKRYRSGFHNLILTDYLEFRWYIDGQLRAGARLADHVKGKLKPLEDGPVKVRAIIEGFLAQQPEEITSPKTLAERLAKLTHIIRDVIVVAFNSGKASATLTDLRAAFAQTLIPELDTPAKTGEFADMYAQTIAYGLFAARCNHRGRSAFVRQMAAQDIPKTNPFLRQLFETITGAAMDAEPYAGLVDDLVALLNHTNIGKVLADFGKRTRREDPIVHFYETFLAAYDPKLRESRGVYYTPEPVVSYIVRSVDWLLKEKFNLPTGLADTSSVTYQRDSGRSDSHGVPITEPAQAPRVLILDPACGTGTFLYSVVDHIREQFMTGDNAGKWSPYVRSHLLPRLLGFELLMAPYAVAHLKLGMQLAAQDMKEALRDKWAYDFSSDDRLGVYLTNSLEEAERQVTTFFGPFRAITDEAAAASRIKRNLPIMVVTGNPPYSPSQFEGAWIMELLGTYKQDLNEQKSDLNREEWKFLRFAHHQVMRTGHGIVAFVINNTFIDGVTHRVLRSSLGSDFSEIYVLNLHGSVLGASGDGITPDINVFDIEQGVAILLLVRLPNHSSTRTIAYHDLRGSRASKYQFLAQHDVSTTSWSSITPLAHNYYWFPRSIEAEGEYEAGWKLTDIFAEYSSGIQTKRDHLTIKHTREEVWGTVQEFASLPIEEARSRFDLGSDGRDWKVALAQTDIRDSGPTQDHIVPMLYRPFDMRYTYYTGKTRGYLAYPRRAIMRHLRVPRNVGLIAMRQIVGSHVSHFGVTRSPNCHGTFFLGNRGQDYLFPMFLDNTTDAPQMELGTSPCRSNLQPEFFTALTERLQSGSKKSNSKDAQLAVSTEDAFAYVVGILHSPTYRTRYKDFLLKDFARVPLTSDPQLFRILVSLGSAAIATHLLDAQFTRTEAASFPLPGSREVEDDYPKYLPPDSPEPGTSKPLTSGRVYINKGNDPDGSRGQYFDNVPPEVWDFHIGGYQVCEKWLKDRRADAYGRSLTFADIEHYQKVVAAIRETIRIMAEIDKTIDAHGGWPIR